MVCHAAVRGPTPLPKLAAVFARRRLARNMLCNGKFTHS